MREFIKEKDFATEMANTVTPYLTARRTEPAFRAADGKPLYVALYTADQPRGTVVLLHGFSENAEKYREFVYYLLREDLSVLAFDQRGHGRSARTAKVGVSHIDSFSEYVNDLEALMASFSETLPSPFYLFAHSMGGAIAMLYLEKHPNVFAKAVLSAPMIDLQYRKFTRTVSRLACRVCTLTGRGQEPVFVVKKDYVNEPFESSAALSRARFSYLLDLRRQAPIFSGGSPSYAWCSAAFGVHKQILKEGAPERVTIPVCILAAENDHLVSPLAQAMLASRLPNGTLVAVAGSKHEILFANDDILHPVLAHILDFFEK